MQNIKKVKGTLWRHLKIFKKKSHSPEKKLKRESFSLVRFCMLRKKGTTIIVYFPGPKGTIWRLEIL